VTDGKEEEEGSSPVSDESMEWMSVDADTMCLSYAEINEFVDGLRV